MRVRYICVSRKLAIANRANRTIFTINNTPHASRRSAPGGFFVLAEEDVAPVYDKPASTIEEQVEIYEKRGLKVPDFDRASHYLKYIGYFRLTQYAGVFYETNNGGPEPAFRENTSFDDVLDLYIFDRKLRLLVMDAIERIEVASRTSISNTLSLQYGPHWLIEADVCKSRVDQAEIITKVARDIQLRSNNGNRRHELINEYFRDFSGPEMPPSWILMESLSFGTVSKLYKSLTLDLQKSISREFGLNQKTFGSWLHSISYLRNLCAHHSRIWNRRFTIKPVGGPLSDELPRLDTFFTQASILQALMRQITNDSTWATRVKELFAEHPNIGLSEMGFPEGWDGTQNWI